MPGDDPCSEPAPLAFSRPAGFADQLPEAARQAAHVRATLGALFEQYGYDPVGVPTLESVDLYHRERIGDALFYGLMTARLPEGAEFPARRHGQDAATPARAEALHDVVLRPEFTAPVARLVVSDLARRASAPDLPLRLHYGGSVFRDLGVGPLRQREFTQVGVEHIGGAPGPADLEVLLLACDAAEALGLPAWRLQVGHAGALHAAFDAWGVPAAARGTVAAGLERLGRLRLKAEASDAAWVRYADARLPEVLRRAHPDDLRAWPALATPASERDYGALRTALPAAFSAWVERSWRAHLGFDSTVVERVLGLAELAGPWSEGEAVERRLTGDAYAPVRRALQPLHQTLADLRSLRPEAALTLVPAPNRGVAYYSGLGFELHTDATGTALTDVCGGGRYDGLHRWIHERAHQTRAVRGLPPLSQPDWMDDALRGVGLSFGVERILAATRPPVPGCSRFWVGYWEASSRRRALRLADALRGAGHGTVVADAPGLARPPQAAWGVICRDGPSSLWRVQPLPGGAQDDGLTERAELIASLGFGPVLRRRTPMGAGAPSPQEQP